MFTSDIPRSPHFCSPLAGWCPSVKCPAWCWGWLLRQDPLCIPVFPCEMPSTLRLTDWAQGICAQHPRGVKPAWARVVRSGRKGTKPSTALLGEPGLSPCRRWGLTPEPSCVKQGSWSLLLWSENLCAFKFQDFRGVWNPNQEFSSLSPVPNWHKWECLYSLLVLVS